MQSVAPAGVLYLHTHNDSVALLPILFLPLVLVVIIVFFFFCSCIIATMVVMSCLCFGGVIFVNKSSRINVRVRGCPV